MRWMKDTKIMLWTVVSLFISIGSSTVLAQTKTVILSTTTSTQDSGLLDVLIPIFEKNTGYFVKTIAVGSGKAMAMGQREKRMYCWFILRRLKRNLLPKVME